MANILDFKNELKQLLPKGNFMMPLGNNKVPQYKFDINNVGKDYNTYPPDMLDEMILSSHQAYAVRTFNTVCVDCDLDKKGKDVPEEFRNTLTQKTGGGGKHYIYKRDERMKHWTNLNGITPFKLDIKIGPNSYFVGNGSISKKY